MQKFRCFDKDTKTMHEVVSIDFRDWRVYYEAYGLRNYWNKNVVLMQSTGLYDKNGVEIFEGSRVKPDRGEPFIVNDFIYGKGVFRSALIADGWHEFDGIYNGSQVEVI